MRGKDGRSTGLSGAPTNTKLPPTLSRSKIGPRLCFAETVSSIKSKVLAPACYCFNISNQNIVFYILSTCFLQTWSLDLFHRVRLTTALFAGSTNQRQTVTCICRVFVLTRKSSAPKRFRASISFEGEVLMTVTWSPKAFPNLTATWPKPPRPTTPSFFPGWSMLCRFIGANTVIPAHNSGAAASKGRLSGIWTTYLRGTTMTNEACVSDNWLRV